MRLDIWYKLPMRLVHSLLRNDNMFAQGKSTDAWDPLALTFTRQSVIRFHYSICVTIKMDAHGPETTAIIFSRAPPSESEKIFKASAKVPYSERLMLQNPFSVHLVFLSLAVESWNRTLHLVSLEVMEFVSKTLTL